MAAKNIIATPEKYQTCKKGDLFRLWKKNEEGDWKRVGCRAASFRALIDGIHYCLSRVPFVWFSKATGNYTGSDTCNPLYQWKFRDWLDNADTIEHRCIEDYRTSGTQTTASYMIQTSSATWYSAFHKSKVNFDGIDGSTEILHTENKYSSNRDGFTASESIDHDAVSVYGGFRMKGFVAQEVLPQKIDIDHHYYIPLVDAEKGDKITDIPERMRLALNNMHMYRRPPAFYWSGAGPFPASSPGAPGDETTLIQDTATFTNVFDNTSTGTDDDSQDGRTATSSGFQCDVYRGGVGRLDVASGAGTFGKQVRVKVYINGQSVNGDGKVKIIGPDHVANNAVRLSFTSAEGKKTETGYIILNSSALPTDLTTSGNKIDIQAMVTTTGSSEEMRIFWMYGVIDPAE